MRESRLKHLIMLLVVLAVCLTLIKSDSRSARLPLAAASPGGDIEPFPFVPPEELLDAEGLCGNSDYDGCSQAFNQIISDNPGTALAAEATLAEIDDLMLLTGSQQVQLLQQMASQYAGTRYEIIAKRRLAILQVNGLSSLMQTMSDLIKEFGGVPVEQVMKEGDTGAFRAQVLHMSLAAQHGLPDVYSAYADGLRSEKKFKEALNIYHFVREEFPMADLNEGGGLVLAIVVNEIRTGTELSVTPGGGEGPPTIKPIAPHANQVIGETSPKIEVELSDGDINHSQVDLTKLVWTLDGRDLTQAMEVGSQINMSGQPGPTFEHLFLTYQPVNPLTPGKHTVYIKVMDYANFTAEKQWSFTVK